ncbi:hypothetical protein [Sphingomonas lenta]|nr:hypothetical protein [Sphingomonas lenta]
MSKQVLWLLVASAQARDVAYVVPTVAWMATDAGALLEVYLESERDGRLFAETGSTVLGGQHHLQFNYLCAAFDVRVVRYGAGAVFDSSVAAFGLPVLAEAETPSELYAALMRSGSVGRVEAVIVGPAADAEPALGNGSRLQAYLFPEMLFRRGLGVSTNDAKEAAELAPDVPVLSFYRGRSAADRTQDGLVRFEDVDQAQPDDTLGSVTLRIASRWAGSAGGVVFADPPAVLAQLASHCRHRRVAVYEPLTPKPPAEIEFSHYTENASPVAAAAAELALRTGNRVITGRQTGDGDIFEWSKRGVSIQIIDPNRPAFPVVETVPHRWAEPLPDPSSDDPDDAQLQQWADEGRVLTSIVFHSGEVAHNEAMLALIELAGWSGLKLGIGAHAARYQTAPQTWELLQVPPGRGGARGLVEPVLHSGGLGVLAECECPATLLRQNCTEALHRIRDLAGSGGTPTGYYAFMDSNFDRLDRVRGDLFSAIADAGLDYIVSSALPGRNRILWKSRDAGTLSINQTPRTIEGASPFVRATTPENIGLALGASGAGWILATFDAPVISFSPYIWREGSRFMAVIDELRRGDRINVLPRTIARYARVLDGRGVLPAPVATGSEDVRAA